MMEPRHRQAQTPPAWAQGETHPSAGTGLAGARVPASGPDVRRAGLEAGVILGLWFPGAGHACVHGHPLGGVPPPHRCRSSLMGVCSCLCLRGVWGAAPTGHRARGALRTSSSRRGAPCSPGWRGTAGTQGSASGCQRSPVRTSVSMTPGALRKACSPGTAQRPAGRAPCVQPGQLSKGRGGACLLAAPRPHLAGEGVLTAVVHVLVQVSRAQGARGHLLEVEAGLGDALHQLRTRAGGESPPGCGHRQQGQTPCLRPDNSRATEWTPSPVRWGPRDAPAPQGRRIPDPVLQGGRVGSRARDAEPWWGLVAQTARARSCAGRGRRGQDQGTRPDLSRGVAGRTSSRAEMVEAGVLGTLLREGLRAGPGEPSESPSPATSWISRARMATSFTSV